MAEGKAIEVGNIFKLKTRFTGAFEVNYDDSDGAKKPVMMGCYGIGPSRVVGTVAEIHNDERGLRWPKAVAPFQVHLISLTGKDAEAAGRVREESARLERELEALGVEVLFDDREEVRAGEKFADADLIGLPLRLVVSEKTLAGNAVEAKLRVDDKAELVPLADINAKVLEFVKA